MKPVPLRTGGREVSAAALGPGRIRIEGTEYHVSALGGGLYRVTCDDRHWVVAVAGPADDRWVFVDGTIAQVEIGAARGRSRRRSGGGGLASPMPATVVRVAVGVGEQVARGDTLVVLEAMKMELPIRAPRDGVIRAVLCRPGELVQPGLDLVDLA